MGLLGMDTFQDELTDQMFSDLVLAGNVVKIADNLNFWGNTEEEFIKVFQMIISQCKEGNLRLKHKTIKLNV